MGIERDDSQDVVLVMDEAGKLQRCRKGALAYAAQQGLREVVWVIHPQDEPEPRPIFQNKLDAALAQGYRQVNPPATIALAHQLINQPRPETAATFPGRAPQVDQLPQDAVPVGLPAPAPTVIPAPQADQLPQDFAPTGHAQIQDRVRAAETAGDAQTRTTGRRRGRPPKPREVDSGSAPAEAAGIETGTIGPDGVKTSRNRGV